MNRPKVTTRSLQTQKQSNYLVGRVFFYTALKNSSRQDQEVVNEDGGGFKDLHRHMYVCALYSMVKRFSSSLLERRLAEGNVIESGVCYMNS